MERPDFLALSWPVSRLGEAITALTRKARLGSTNTELANAAYSQNDNELKNWIPWAAGRLGCEATVLAMPFRELQHELAAAYPALLQLSEDACLIVVAGSGRKLHVLTSDLEVRQVSVRDLAAAIREPAERTLSADLGRILKEAGLPLSKQRRTLDLLLDEQASGKHFDRCWILRSQAWQEHFPAIDRGERRSECLRPGNGAYWAVSIVACLLGGFREPLVLRSHGSRMAARVGAAAGDANSVPGVNYMAARPVRDRTWRMAKTPVVMRQLAIGARRDAPLRYRQLSRTGFRV